MNAEIHPFILPNKITHRDHTPNANIRSVNLEDLTKVISSTIKSSLPAQDTLIYSLQDLGSGYYFKQPFTITIEYFDDEYLVCFLDLNLYGSGDTSYEALEMLKREIVSLYKDLKDLPKSKLGKHPKAWQQFFKFYLGKHK